MNDQTNRNNSAINIPTLHVVASGREDVDKKYKREEGEEKDKDLLIPYQDFYSAYQTYQAVYIPKVAIISRKIQDNKKPKSSFSKIALQHKDHQRFTWNDIGPLYESLNAQDQSSWCIEHKFICNDDDSDYYRIMEIDRNVKREQECSDDNKKLSNEVALKKIEGDRETKVSENGMDTARDDRHDQLSNARQSHPGVFLRAANDRDDCNGIAGNGIDPTTTYKDSHKVEDKKEQDRQTLPQKRRRCQKIRGIMNRRRGYCSFLVQHDKKKLEETLSLLPVQDLPIFLPPPTADTFDNAASTTFVAAPIATATTSSSVSLPPTINYGPCLWFFFGWNTVSSQQKQQQQEQEEQGGKAEEGIKDLEGRSEHTDAVSHDGTWHYQLSGRKRWYLRPTQELLRRLSCQAKAKPCNIGGLEESKQGNSKSQTTIIECSEGDMIVLNTRLWWHRTVIPPHYNLNEPSVSYARDMYMLPRCGLKTHFESDKRIMSDNSIVDHSNLLQQSERRGEEGLEIMSNLDGLYAANDIDVNTIIFTEASMPDCSLHRSSVPNCQVIQMEEGSGAVVSIRQIKAGDFFCVGESDDDEEDEDTDAAEGDDDFDSSNECDEENCGVRDMERRMDKCD